MRYLSSVNGINRYAFIEIRTARFPKETFLKGLADINLKSIALEVSHDDVRVFYRDNNVVPIDIDHGRISPNR
jgi:hypothetical protein